MQEGKPGNGKERPRLTRKQRKVLRLCLKLKTTKSKPIAAKLRKSVSAIDKIIDRIKDRLGAADRGAMYGIAMGLDLSDDENGEETRSV